ncbi:molybdopterin cofactor-binding domain-containing protein, partial [Tateyamaria sp.]|uniref:molybdopterin cofactor-binding domain-containing protein n=1 Tax=Tateyamaria sp. TaxID=1929288 RepID=UPI0032DC8C36
MNKWTRRAFISAGVVVGGGILVGVAMRPGNRIAGLQDAVAGDGETLVHAFIKIDQDNIVTVISPHSEMGQGAQTALAQMAAEELDADWEKVRIEEAPALGDYSTYTLGRGYLLKDVPLPGAVIPTIDGVMMRVSNALNAQITGGSLSIRATGQYGMRVAGAATKDMLKQAAADAWGVPIDQIETEKSMLLHRASSRTEPYATFATAAAEMTPSYNPRLKEIGDFSIIGQSVERQDIPGKVDGTAPFALDVRLPDMVYATTRRAPVFGGTVVQIDDTEARQMASVIDVITLPSDASEDMIGGYGPTGESVAVVADSYWTALQALETLTIEWDSKGLDSVTSETIFEKHASDLTAGTGREHDLSQGDIDAAFEGAPTVIEAEYRVPYLAHTTMEQPNATAHVTGAAAEIWVGCQNPLGFRRKIATALDMNEDQVTLNNTLMGGGFGRKSVP